MELIITTFYNLSFKFYNHQVDYVISWEISFLHQNYTYIKLQKFYWDAEEVNPLLYSYFLFPVFREDIKDTFWNVEVCRGPFNYRPFQRRIFLVFFLYFPYILLNTFVICISFITEGFCNAVITFLEVSFCCSWIYFIWIYRSWNSAFVNYVLRLTLTV